MRPLPRQLPSAALASVQGLEAKLEAEAQRTTEAKERITQLEADKCTLQKNAEKVLETHREDTWRLTETKDREIDAAQKERLRLNSLVAEEKARAEDAQREARQREEKIIADLEARVKRTIQAKDDAIGELRTRCAASENKTREFEYLLARQREELLTGITRDILS